MILLTEIILFISIINYVEERIQITYQVRRNIIINLSCFQSNVLNLTVAPGFASEFKYVDLTLPLYTDGFRVMFDHATCWLGVMMSLYAMVMLSHGFDSSVKNNGVDVNINHALSTVLTREKRFRLIVLIVLQLFLTFWHNVTRFMDKNCQQIYENLFSINI